MKKAWYEVVKTEEEKNNKIREFRENRKNYPDVYSVYIDCDIRYDTALSKRNSFRSLMNAVRKKKVDTILIPSMEAFHVSEVYALDTLLKLKKQEITVWIGTEPKGISNLVSEKEIISKMQDLYEEYLTVKVSVPMITMEDCYVSSACSIPFVFLERDKEQAKKRYSYDVKAEEGNKKLFADVISESQDKGLFLFRSDVDEWYRIDPYGARILKMIYDINNEIMFEEIFKEL